MKKSSAFLCFIVALIIFVSFSLKNVYSDELDDITKRINDLQNSLNMSIQATAPLESQINGMKNQIQDIEDRVSFIEADIETKKNNIDKSYKNLAKQQDMLNRTIRNYYIKTYSYSPFVLFASAQDAANITRILVYQKREADNDKAIITNIAVTITDLENRKIQLEDEEQKLSSVKEKVSAEKQQLQKIVDGAKQYQASLSNQIAELSARQQELLAQKLASLNIPRSAYNMKGGCSSDLINGKDPGFSPRFGFFTYGVPNRVGMNQYGAKGRAENNQLYPQILQAYYNADLTSGYNQSINIHVVGSNDYGQSFDVNWNIEEYLKHIYEMPTDWPADALKAQVIAARSYALSATNNGSSSICADQHCQEVKQETNSQAWIDAVTSTAGMVLTNGGQPIKAWYSSTHGGYAFTSGDIGWDNTSWTKRLRDTSADVNSFSDLQSNAYDKNSPWFYCDWGARSEYGGTAWLKQDELADIVNVLLLAKNDSSTQKHLSQVDKPNPDGVDTWDASRVKQELQNRHITPYNNITGISIDWDKSVGRVNTVNVSGDAGTNPFTGDEFKNYFNLRAPANIQIVGPLYNAEQR